MESINEIVKILSRKRLDKIELLDFNILSDDTSLMSKLLSASLKEEVLSDTDALLYLYQKDNPKSQQNFRRLKSRFKSRIYNTLFFIDQNKSNFSAHQRVIIEQNKIVQTVQILRRLGANKSAVDLIKNNFHVAVEYQLYDIAKFYSFELAKHSAVFGNIKLFEKYKANYDDFLNKEEIIQSATFVYYQIQLIVHESKEIRKASSDKLKLDQLLAQLEHYSHLFSNNDTSYFFLRSKLLINEYLGKYEDSLDTCQAIIQLSTQDNFKQPVWQGIAALYKAKTFLSIGDYNRGFLELSKDILLFKEGGLNWLTAMEFLLKLKMFQLDVSSAEELLNKIIKHKSFKSAPEHFKQRISIYKSYWLLMQDEIELKLNKRIKVAKLINDTTYYVSDKLGFFLAIRFLELIEQLRAGDIFTFEEKCILLKKYSKQMSQNALIRDKDFSTMILSIKSLKYNKKAIFEKNHKLYEDLQSNKEKNFLNDFEVLPYHFLWEIILRYL
ncbi:MAG: hypothetical protein LC105_12740 [Chitinophagales bacterium]|nr:hypothetical protein [Chitinophagales bacterium]MCZ2394721.1 hypothetical protein [Chitinophagales bacterium]